MIKLALAGLGKSWRGKKVHEHRQCSLVGYFKLEIRKWEELWWMAGRETNRGTGRFYSWLQLHC